MILMERSILRKFNRKWTNQIRKLTNKYLHTSDGAEQTSSVKKGVKEAERKMLEERMQEKSALTMYRSQKKDIRKEKVSDNSSGSSLLFEGRTRALELRHIRLNFKDRRIMCRVL